MAYSTLQESITQLRIGQNTLQVTLNINSWVKFWQNGGPGVQVPLTVRPSDPSMLSDGILKPPVAGIIGMSPGHAKQRMADFQTGLLHPDVTYTCLV